MSETLLDYMRRIARKEQAKGFGPWRTTREVADYWGWNVAKARRELDRLYQLDAIHAYKEGRDILWAYELP